MKALLWKDFRINLPVLLAAVFCWCLLQLLVLINIVFFVGHENASRLLWSDSLTMTNLASLVFGQLFVGALGANAIACERADRSAEFLFSLPPARGRILASKLIVALALAVAVWVLHVVMLEIVIPIIGDFPRLGNDRMAGMYPAMLASALCLFGCSWLGSSLLKSAAYALLVGIVLAGGAGAAVWNFQRFANTPVPPALNSAFHATYVILGIAAFLAGSIYYLRRVEP